MSANAKDFSFRKVFTSLRPARIAILLDQTDQEWMDTCLRIVEWTTGLWGGWYSCLVPTNGDTIPQRFWDLMGKFDPDYIYAYRKTMVDVKVASPETFERWLRTEVEGFVRQNPDANPEQTRQAIERQLDVIAVHPLQITEGLHRTLLKRLNPFFHDGNPMQGSVHARGGVAYPLTPVSELVPNIARPVQLTDPNIIASKTVQLMVYAIVGKLSSELTERLRNHGAVIERKVPDTFREVTR